jgi:hypothetical protein
MTSQHGPHRKHHFSAAVQLLLWKHACLRSHYLAMAVVQSLTSWSLQWVYMPQYDIHEDDHMKLKHVLLITKQVNEI